MIAEIGDRRSEIGESRARKRFGVLFLCSRNRVLPHALMQAQGRSSSGLRSPISDLD
jgi:hypothetical protein